MVVVLVGVDVTAGVVEAKGLVGGDVVVSKDPPGVGDWPVGVAVVETPPGPPVPGKPAK